MINLKRLSLMVLAMLVLPLSFAAAEGRSPAGAFDKPAKVEAPKAEPSVKEDSEPRAEPYVDRKIPSDKDASLGEKEPGVQLLEE
jgi:hypothetical protein